MFGELFDDWEKDGPSDLVGISEFGESNGPIGMEETAADKKKFREAKKRTAQDKKNLREGRLPWDDGEPVAKKKPQGPETAARFDERMRKKKAEQFLIASAHDVQSDHSSDDEDEDIKQELRNRRVKHNVYRLSDVKKDEAELEGIGCYIN